MDMSLSKLWEIVKDRESRHAAVHSVAKSWTWLSDWKTTSQACHLHPGPAYADLTLHILWSLCMESVLSDHFLQWLVTDTGLGLEEGRERLREKWTPFCGALSSFQSLGNSWCPFCPELFSPWLLCGWQFLVTHMLPSKAIQSKASSLNTFPPSQFSSVQSLSRVRLFATPWIAARQASLSITNSWSSLRLTSIESVIPSSHLILCHPLLLLPPIPPSIRVFSNESTLRMRWPKYWSFSFSISSKEIPGLISFRMDWLDLLAVQGTLKSLLQHYSSKASILQSSAFFTVQLSHPYTTTGKTIALTRRTFVGKVSHCHIPCVQ